MEKDLDSDHKFNLSMVLQQQPLKEKEKKDKANPEKRSFWFAI